MSEETQEWKIVKVEKKDNPSWIISTRTISGTNFLEYKIEGNVMASTHACMSSFRKEIHNQADKVKNKKYPVYKIIEETNESLLTYVVHKEPFPFKNTEMSVRYFFLQNSEENIQEVRWEESWEEESVPLPSKKLSRVQSFRGSWCFSQISKNHTKAKNSVQFDPKKMPLWLVEPMVFKFLKGGLNDIRNTVSI